jgi:hypothetical protein
VNPADVAPEFTVTFAGTLTAALLLDRVTTVLPLAAASRFTVHDALAPLARFDGLQLTELTSTEFVAVTVTVVCADAL